ncbi:hypothetical protein WSS15_13930 [Acetobacter pasteurianus]|nr:hypothetical protein WSS15_13930 [Acetobacter pasteurianus]
MVLPSHLIRIFHTIMAYVLLSTSKTPKTHKMALSVDIRLKKKLVALRLGRSLREAKGLII